MLSTGLHFASESTGIGEEGQGCGKRGSGWQVVADAKRESEDKADKAKVKVQNAVGGLKDVVREAVEKC